MTALVVALIVVGAAFVYQTMRAAVWRSEAMYWQRRDALSRKCADNWMQAFLRLARKAK